MNLVVLLCFVKFWLRYELGAWSLTELLSVRRKSGGGLTTVGTGVIFTKASALKIRCTSRKQIWKGKYCSEGRYIENSLGAFTDKGREGGREKGKKKKSTKPQKRPRQSGKPLGIGTQVAWSKRAKTPFTACQHCELGQNEGHLFWAAFMEGSKRQELPRQPRLQGLHLILCTQPTMRLSFAYLCN